MPEATTSNTAGVRTAAEIRMPISLKRVEPAQARRWSGHGRDGHRHRDCLAAVTTVYSVYVQRLRNGEAPVRVVLSNSSGVPLYQQIKEQVGTAVLSGELAEGAALPSVRALARDLRISVITTTRAYAELAAEGFIATVPGKGAYVLPLDSELVREQLLRQAEEGLQAALVAARRAGLERDDLVQMLDGLLSTATEETFHA
jgi:GntR family transcriptional regulator